MKKLRTKKAKGFTLMEVVLAIAILAVLMMFFSAILLQGNNIILHSYVIDGDGRDLRSYAENIYNVEGNSDGVSLEEVTPSENYTVNVDFGDNDNNLDIKLPGKLYKVKKEDSQVVYDVFNYIPEVSINEE